MYGDQGSRRLSNIRTGVDEQNPTVDEPTSPAHPIASYPPIIIDKDDLRPVSNAKGRRAAEFYGFVAWLLTLLVYIAYILWTVLPDEVIRATGIEWYPARQVCNCRKGSCTDTLANDSEWAILFPAWSVMLFLTAYCVYLALGIYGTPALSSLSTITGEPRPLFFFDDSD